MSEYQYYEFCTMNKPLSAEARKEMLSLSSRAKVTTHGASYVYNYGDFRGKTKELLLKHFDVFFYISNFGCIKLMFKYLTKEVNPNALKKYLVKHTIDYSAYNSHILLAISFVNENGLGWLDGEGMLPDLLPLYDEIKSKNYNFLQLVAQVAHKNDGIVSTNHTNIILSPAEETFFRYADIDTKIFNK